MKKVICVLLISCAAGVAWADEAVVDKGFYIGATAGRHNVDVSGLSNAAAGGLMGGYRISNGLGVELAFTGSDVSADSIMAGCLFELDTAAIYAAFRRDGPVYFKGRAGLLNETITPRDACAGLTSEASESGLSIGAGGGFRFGRGAFEVEYTIVEQDVDQISANLIYNF